MGTKLVVNIFQAVRGMLQDGGEEPRWSDSDLLTWYNEALKEIVKLLPTANAKVINHSLVAGAAQALPATAIGLLSVGRNLGVNGTSPGKVPAKVSKEVMDGTFSEWQNSTANAKVGILITTASTPRLFYTYPPQPAVPAKLELTIAQYPVPVLIANISTATLELDDIHETLVINYLLYKACGQDGDNLTMFDRSQSYGRLFYGALGAPTPARSKPQPAQAQQENA